MYKTKCTSVGSTCGWRRLLKNIHHTYICLHACHVYVYNQEHIYTHFGLGCLDEMETSEHSGINQGGIMTGRLAFHKVIMFTYYIYILYLDRCYSPRSLLDIK